MLEFQYPDILLGFFIIVPFGLALLLLTRSRPTVWKLYSLILPLLAALFVILAAAGPVVHFSASAGRIIVALDDSPAAVTAPWRKRLWLRKFLTTHLPHGVHVSLVTFASRPHVIASGLLPESVPVQPIGLNATSRRRGSTRRLLKFSGSTPLWIFTTGLLHWQLPSSSAVPNAPIAATVIPPTSVDVGITGLQWVFSDMGRVNALHPNHLSPQLQVTLRSTGSASLVLVESCGGHLLLHTPLRFRKAGVKKVLLPPPAHKVIRTHQAITIQLVNHDFWPGDNRAEIRIPTRSMPHVLIITPKPAAKASLIPGWIPRTLPPGQFPHSRHGLERFQAVVLDNVPINALSVRAQKHLSAYVTAIGGGLLIAGTHNAFGPGGYGLPQGTGNAPSILEQLSPLSCLPPHPQPLHIIFLMDVSGSLGNATASGVTRFALAAHAVCSAVQLLKPTDHITILLFSGQTRTLINGDATAVRPVLPELLAKIVPNGPTRPNSALPILHNLLTKHALLIVVTDGRIPHLNVPAWKHLLQRDAVEFAVAAPGHSSRATKELIAATGATQLPKQHISQWDRVLRTLISRKIRGTPNTAPLAWNSRASNLQGRTNLWDRVYLKHRPTLVAHSRQYPLAARWRRGLGQVGAICFSDNSTAARRLYTSMLNSIQAPRGNPHFSITAHHKLGRWFLAVQAVRHGRFLNEFRLNATVIQPHGKIMNVALPQLAPGRYGAAMPPSVQAFSAAVWQLSSPAARRHQTFIGRISPPRLPNKYFPATGKVAACPWPTAIEIPADAPAFMRWNPTLSTHSFHLSDLFWALALLSALTAIYHPW